MNLLFQVRHTNTSLLVGALHAWICQLYLPVYRARTQLHAKL